MQVDRDIPLKFRSEACDVLHVAILLASLSASGIVAFAAPEFISAAMLRAILGLAALLFALFLWRKRIAYPIRATVLAAIGLTIGLVKLAALGMPYGLLDLAVVTIMGAVFFGERAGIALVIAVLTMIAATHVAFAYGLVPPPRNASPLGDATWMLAVNSLLAATVGPLIAISRLGQRLNVERTIAQAQNASKSEFMAILGHELKTPLNAIMGFSEALKLGYAGPQGSSKYKDYASDIHDSSQHLRKIVESVLELARIDALQYKAHLQTVSVTNEISRAVTAIDELSKSAGLNLRLSAGAEIPPVMADPTLLHQILLNLLSNAIKYTPAGGSVVIGATAESGNVRIQVRDTGIGIHESEIPNLFKPFQRGKGLGAEAKEGSGLGLVLVKLFTELQGGTIHVESKAGEGTLVTIELPTATA